MRFQTFVVHGLALIASFSLSLAAHCTAADAPNLVFIIADDCTYLDLEVYGGQAKTPHLNSLAEQGMKFNRCFQAAPMCSPTRHNIYTGIYPVKSGAWPNHTCVYPGTKSIAHYLKDAGYRVALSGKTHIAPRESFPFEYSGEFRTADPHAADPYPTINQLMTDSVQQESPFCLFACSNEPHTPWDKGDASAYPPESLQLAPTWVDTAETRQAYSKYLAEITYFDAQCGALLDLIDKHGLTDNTMVMVVSEQGSSFPFAKWTCFEMGLASGMIARWPDKIAAGSSTDALVEYVDIAPTFLAAAGVPTPETMDGRSFLPVLMGTAPEHKTYTFGIHTTQGIINGTDAFGIRSCGTKTHRYIRNLHPDAVFSNAVTKTSEKQSDLWRAWMERAKAGDKHAVAMTEKYMRRPAEELYNVVDDPHCLRNLAVEPQYAGLKQELSAELDRWMKQQGDQGAATEEIARSRSAKGQSKPPKTKQAKSKPKNKKRGKKNLVETK